jgi:hypothetical protein
MLFTRGREVVTPTGMIPSSEERKPKNLQMALSMGYLLECLDHDVLEVTYLVAGSPVTYFSSPLFQGDRYAQSQRGHGCPGKLCNSMADFLPLVMHGELGSHRVDESIGLALGTLVLRNTDGRRYFRGQSFSGGDLIDGNLHSYTPD